MRTHRIAAWMLATALAGCSLGPRPAAPVPVAPAAAWNGQEDAAGWPSTDWWKAFGSPELDGLIADAVAQNDDLAAAQAGVIQADAQARIAGAALLPTIGAAPVAEATRSITTNDGLTRQYGTLNGVVAVSYQLDFWGRNRDARLSARESAQAAAYDVAVTRITIVTSVVSTYFNLLATQDQLNALQVQAGEARKLLDGLAIQEQHGLVTGLQVEQQRELADQLSAGIPPLQAQRTHLIDALALLTGRNPEGFEIAGGSLLGLTLPPIAAGIPSDLLVHRPDVQEAERNLAAAGADISVARKAFLPSFGLTGSGGAGSLALGSALVGPTSIFAIGLNILQPIFDGGKMRGQLDLANGVYKEHAADYLKAIHQAYGDVEDALASAQQAREQVARQDAATASAQRAVAMARAAFAAGTTDTIPLLTAQQALAAARAQQAQARLAQAQGLAELYKALGSGWQSQN